MTRRSEDLAEGSSEVEVPRTIGDLLPGMPHKSEDGVDVHALPIGFLRSLVMSGIKAEVAASERRATSGIAAREEKDRHEEARKRGTQAALDAFSHGLLPSAVPSEAEHIHRAAVDYVESYRDALCGATSDPEAALEKWFEDRMNADEKAKLGEPRNQSRKNCVKRLAAAWLEKEGLPPEASVKRDEVVSKGKHAFAGAMSQAKQAIERHSSALLSPVKNDETEAPPVSIEISDDMGF